MTVPTAQSPFQYYFEVLGSLMGFFSNGFVSLDFLLQEGVLVSYYLCGQVTGQYLSHVKVLRGCCHTRRLQENYVDIDLLNIFVIRIGKIGLEIPGIPVVKTQHIFTELCGVHSLHPWLGKTNILRAMWHRQEKKPGDQALHLLNVTWGD